MNEARYRDAERRFWDSVGAQPTERRIDLARTGLSVRVREVGDGPPVLFVHGVSTDGTSWAPLVGQLEGFRCIVLDRPGCGLSEPVREPFNNVVQLATFASTLLVDVLDALGVEAAHLVATSFGGYFALRTAASHPERVNRVVMLGWTVGAPIGHVPLVMRVASHPALGRLFTRIPPNERMVRSMLKRIGLRQAMENGRVSPEFVSAYLALLRDTATMRNEIDAGPRLITLRGFDERILIPASVLAAIRAPTSFLWGAEDPFGGEEVARPFVAQVPGAKLEMLSGAGHAVWIDDPDRVAHRIQAFLAPETTSNP